MFASAVTVITPGMTGSALACFRKIATAGKQSVINQVRCCLCTSSPGLHAGTLAVHDITTRIHISLSILPIIMLLTSTTLGWNSTAIWYESLCTGYCIPTHIMMPVPENLPPDNCSQPLVEQTSHSSLTSPLISATAVAAAVGPWSGRWELLSPSTPCIENEKVPTKTITKCGAASLSTYLSYHYPIIVLIIPVIAFSSI